MTHSAAEPAWTSVRLDTTRQYALFTSCHAAAGGAPQERPEAVAVKLEGGRKRPRSPAPAADGPEECATGPEDRLRFTLAALSGPGGAWGLAAPVAARHLCPAAVAPAVYCRLLDSVLRLPGEAGDGGERRLSVCVAAAADGVRRVDLRYALPTASGGPSSLLLAALELRPEAFLQGPTGAAAGAGWLLAAALEAAGRQLGSHHAARAELARRTAELADAHAHIRRLTRARLADAALLPLETVQALVNEKKRRIAELAEALRRARQEPAKLEPAEKTEAEAVPAPEEKKVKKEEPEPEPEPEEEEGELGGYSTGDSEGPVAPGTANNAAPAEAGGGGATDATWIDDLFGDV